MRGHFFRILLFFSLIGACDLQAQDQPVVFSGSEKNLKIGRYTGILEDKTSQLQVWDVVRSADFKSSTEQIPNLGVSNSTFWIRFTVVNSSQHNHLLLELASPLTDVAELFLSKEDGTAPVGHISETKPFNARKYKVRNYLFDINIAPGETQTYYLKIKSSELIQLPLIIGTTDSIFESLITANVLSGLYFGIILVMLFYNLFIYFTVRDRSYLFYVVYILFIGLTQATLHGYGTKYLWPDSPWFMVHAIFLVPSVTGIVAIIFVNNFLQVKTYAPVLMRFSYVIAAVYVVGIGLGVLGQYFTSYNIIDFNALLLSIYMLWVAIRIMRRGYRPAKFFLLAWSFFLICVIVFVATSKNVLPYNTYTASILELGSAVEVMLLSFALADRINILQREKEESQKKALETLKENERIVSQQNVILEEKVKERTAELETSNRNLKETQVQLVNAEKMASLGQLTAGIAHEINNPINFVISNVTPLKRDIGDILRVLDKYGEIRDDKTLDEKLQEVGKLKKQLDTDYLVQEIDLLLKGIGEGAARTSEIVRGLQNFSRLDEDGLKMANIHMGIDATLLLLNSNINQKKIQIIKDYGDFGDIECNPGKLNQVFMNILNNAIQAFDPMQTVKQIWITTRIENNQLRISIRDNGPGMDEKVKNRIFEPFFTTKSIGEGSGLGLSIVYGIIEKHKGKIRVESEPGKGTEFTILLPVR